METMAAFAVCTGFILIVCSLLNWFYSEHVIRKQESFEKVAGIYALIVIAAAVTLRFLQNELPDALLIGALLKFSASLPTVLFALKGYQMRWTRFGFYILLAICCCMIADVSINISFAAGGLFFLAGHLIYDFAFLSEIRPSVRQILLWLILIALMILSVYALRNAIGSTADTIGWAVYFMILISTIVFSWSLEKPVFAAVLVFAFSDCFLFFNSYFQGTMLMTILALLVYYGSLLLYGAALWIRNHRIETA